MLSCHSLQTSIYQVQAYQVFWGSSFSLPGSFRGYKTNDLVKLVLYVTTVYDAEVHTHALLGKPKLDHEAAFCTVEICLRILRRFTGSSLSNRNRFEHQ